MELTLIIIMVLPKIAHQLFFRKLVEGWRMEQGRLNFGAYPVNLAKNSLFYSHLCEVIYIILRKPLMLINAILLLLQRMWDTVFMSFWVDNPLTICVLLPWTHKLCFNNWLCLQAERWWIKVYHVDSGSMLTSCDWLTSLLRYFYGAC